MLSSVIVSQQKEALHKERMSTAPYSTWSGNTVSSSVAVHPASLAKHPQRWTKDEVRVWLRWCSEEFSIEPVPPDKFDMNGKALCLLARSDFMERLPKNGDVLYNCLQTLITKSIGGAVISQQNQPTPSGIVGSSLSFGDKRSPLQRESFQASLLLVSSSNSQTSHSPAQGTHVPSRPFIPIQPRLGQSTLPTLSVSNHPVLSRSSPNLPLKVVERMSLDDESQESGIGSPSQSRVQTPGTPAIKTEQPCSPEPNTSKESLYSLRTSRSTDCRLLWEFIHQLLLDSKFSKYVCWENKEDYVFRIANPTGLAELWGQQKNRTNMTYEKLSRALRYYYRMNIIRKVPGKRLTYKFLQPPSQIQKGQRGAKPHSKMQVHLPATVSSPGNDSNLKYEDESDFDSTPSDMDSPENPGNKQSRQNSTEDNDVAQGETEQNINKNVFNKNIFSNFPPYSNIHFPYHLQSGFGRSAGLVGQETVYDSPHTDVHYLNSNISNECYGVTDGGTDKFYSNINNTSDTEYHPGKVIRPMPSYPSSMGDCGAFSHFVKQETNLVRAHSTSSNDFRSAGKDRVLRLPIDSLYRSQSCEFPVKESELVVPYPGHRPGHARSVSPRVDLQSEPEDLSVKREVDAESRDFDSDTLTYQYGESNRQKDNSDSAEYRSTHESNEEMQNTKINDSR